MRTKTLLCTAAVVAAGLGASFAQSVYSVNSVGYVNVTLVGGFNLISNPLNGTNNNINTIMPTAPNNAVAARWDNVAQTFAPADTYFEFGPGDPNNGWYDGSFNLSSSVINPGEAFFLQNPGGTTTITFVGEVPQGQLTNRIVQNYGFYSSIVPQATDLLSIGFPGQDQMTYSQWDANAQTYGQALTYFHFGPGDPNNGFYDGSFNLASATSIVGGGFLIFNPASSVSWERTFSVN
jgi:hypothetical protein